MQTDAGLHFIREHELAYLRRHLPSTGRILEIGAGTGYQARALSETGYEVEALDTPTSKYKESRVFPVVEYDGAHFPFPGGSFDVVFSSNLLEHIPNLASFLAETRRVLRPDSYAIHVMPSPTWRLWTLVTGPLDAFPFVAKAARSKANLIDIAEGLKWRLLQGPHGERGIALTELWTFRRTWWIRTFERNHFDVVLAEPMGLLYSGWQLFGTAMSLSLRRRLAGSLGSSCTAYVVKPRPQ